MRVGVDGRAFDSPAGGVRRYVGELYRAILQADETVEIDGDRAVIDEFLSYLDTFAVWFPIASP